MLDISIRARCAEGFATFHLGDEQEGLRLLTKAVGWLETHETHISWRMSGAMHSCLPNLAPPGRVAPLCVRYIQLRLKNALD